MLNDDSEIPDSLDDEIDKLEEMDVDVDFEDDEMDIELEKELENLSENKPSESPLESINISEIRVKIQIEVSRFEVSLEELSRMEPGYKLPIEINPRLVQLTVAGKVIGKGEIIEIGDTIGVKILELYK
jgi:flagellar motor switch protein FliN